MTVPFSSQLQAREIPALSLDNLVGQLPQTFPGFFQRHNLRHSRLNPHQAEPFKPLTQRQAALNSFLLLRGTADHQPSIRHRPSQRPYSITFSAQASAPFPVGRTSGNCHLAFRCRLQLRCALGNALKPVPTTLRFRRRITRFLRPHAEPLHRR